MEVHLRQLRAETQGYNPMGVVADPVYVQGTILEAELALLVEGLIGDHQIFESFGYENLHERGYLTYERWMAWNNSKIIEAQDHLDRIFHATGHSEGVNDFDTAVNDNLAEEPLAHPSMLSGPSWKPHFVGPEDQDSRSLSLAASSGLVAETQRLLDKGINPNEPPSLSTNGSTTILVEAIRNGHQQVVSLLIAYGANVDGASQEVLLHESNSPLIAAIYKGEARSLLNCWIMGRILRSSHTSSKKTNGWSLDRS